MAKVQLKEEIKKELVLGRDVDFVGTGAIWYGVDTKAKGITDEGRQNNFSSFGDTIPGQAIQDGATGYAARLVKALNEMISELRDDYSERSIQMRVVSRINGQGMT